MVFLFLLSSLIYQSLDRSSERIDLTLENTNEYLLSIDQLPIYVDSIGTLRFQDLNHQKIEFNLYKDFKPKDYCSSCAYWIKVPLHLSKNSGREWIIEFYDQTIDSISGYLPKANGSYEIDHVGDYFPFHEKPFEHKNFEWLINDGLTGSQEIYFRVKSHSYADIRLAIRTIDRFVHYSLNEYFLYGIFYGMIFIISVYNMLIFFAIRERRYLYYMFYIISVGVYAMCIDGIAYQYLWPEWPAWNQIAYGTALFSLILWSLVFSRQFLNTSIRVPLLDKILVIATILRSVIFAYALIFDHQIFEYRNIEIIPLTLIFYTSIVVWKEGYKPARFFVLAYGILFLGFLIKALLYLSIIPFVILSYYSLHVCFLLEMLFLTFALSDRVRILKSNRDKAQRRALLEHRENAELKDKVNRELEEKIKERTRQLEEKNIALAESNQKLYKQTEEINLINSKLDLDNWKLKNNIKEVLQDRLINKSLTYDQFRSVFPNEIACYRFLENLKWRNSYSCLKCHHKKYSDGNLKFSRRCSRCGYDESITSNTVFHRLKFPIEKAFYILYVSNNAEKEYTLDGLAEILQLRRNTIWNFRKKIKRMYTSEESRLIIQDLFTNQLS